MRKRQRLLVELTVSILSGTILAAAATVAATLSHVQWLEAPVPLWSVVLGSTTAVVLAIFLIRLREQRPKRVLIMIPAFVQKHWFAEFLQRGVQALESQGYDAVLKLPLHDFSGQGQLLQLTAVARRPRDFVGAFIIAAEPDSIGGELRRLCSRAGFPVIFVDVMPFARPEDLPAWSCYVGSDQKEIGVAAARYVADQMAQRQKRRPRVLVVGSEAQAERQRTFVAALKDKIPGAIVDVNDHGAFVRDRSREIAGRYLRSARQEGRLLDAIFCTNDEMALGALDALHEDAVSEEVHSDLIVIGVDGD